MNHTDFFGIEHTSGASSKSTTSIDISDVVKERSGKSVHEIFGHGNTPCKKDTPHTNKKSPVEDLPSEEAIRRFLG